MRKFGAAASIVALMAALAACGDTDQANDAEDVVEQVETEVGDQTEATAEQTDDIAVSEADLEGNPFLQEWDTPYGVPPFAEIEDEHFMPAIKDGILKLRAEIDTIVDNPEPATFENTIVALD
ncbi:MAG: M3 family peptidase, partial [Pseudomonadota bacterium]